MTQQALPSVSCICLTFDRPKLLARAIEDFLNQDYGGAMEMVVFNSHPLQHIVFDHPLVRVVNCRPRPDTLGECRNKAVGHAAHDVIVVWDDDDRFKPNHVSSLVRDLGSEEAVKVNGFFAHSGNGPDTFEPLGPANQLVFTKRLFDEVGGYPNEDFGEDVGLRVLMERRSFVREVMRGPGDATMTYNNSPGMRHVSWTSSYADMGSAPPSVRGHVHIHIPGKAAPAGPVAVGEDSSRGSGLGLAVIACHFNPSGWIRPTDNLFRFQRHMQECGVPVYWSEAVFPGGRGITGSPVISATADNLMWQKERMLNLALERVPTAYRYVAWVDADIIFETRYWPEMAVAALQKDPIVQLWRSASELRPDGRLEPVEKLSCGYGLAAGAAHYKLDVFHPGFAWAARREVLEKAGGLMDTNITGGGDSLMLYAATNAPPDWVEKYLSGGWLDSFHEWKAKLRGFDGGVGHLPINITHLQHGSRKNRQYMKRWDLLVNHGFDPREHLVTGENGLWQWSHRAVQDKPAMIAGVRDYFRTRKEDE